MGMDIDELKRRISMPEVVGQYGIKISRAGFIRCPFHTEKTASCKIYPDSFHCFGCGAHGDIFSFVQRMEGCSFSQAYKRLSGEDVRLSDARKARIIQRQIAAKEKADRGARLKKEFFQACHDLRIEEYILDHCGVGGPAWMAAANEIPKLQGWADELLERLWAN